MLGTPRMILGKMLVDPLYAGNQYGKHGLVLPDVVQETRPVLGDVLAAGPDALYAKGQRVVLRPSFPTIGIPLYQRLGAPLVVSNTDVVGHMEGTEFQPKPEEVVIIPDWRQKYKQVSSLIYLPPSALEQNQPVYCGVVAKVGSKCKTLKVADYVIYPNVGFELGLIDTLYYIIPEKEILATIHAN